MVLTVGAPKNFCYHFKQYLRLGLGGVISQGNTFALDFVETLLTEVVPVSKKPIFWWTTRSPSAQPITERARRSSRQSGQGRAGQDRPGGGHTGGGRGQGRSSPGGSSQSWCRVFVWADVLILHVNFGVDDWSHQNRPMQTSQALKKEGEKEKRGKGGRWGEGSKWIFKKKRREIICYRSDEDNGEVREGRTGGDDVNNNNQEDREPRQSKD